MNVVGQNIGIAIAVEIINLYVIQLQSSKEMIVEKEQIIVTIPSIHFSIPIAQYFSNLSDQ